MAKYLTQNLVDLSGRGLRSDRAAELGFYHAEHTLHIRPFVVVGQERFPIEVVEVPHLVPEAIVASRVASHALGITLEGDVGRPTRILDGMKVAATGIGFVSRNLFDRECLSRLFQQGDEFNRVCGFVGTTFNTGHNVRFDPAHQVNLDIRLPLEFLAILVIKPSCIGGSREAGGINSEVGFHCSQRASTLLNERLQNRSEFRVLQIPSIAGKGWGLSHQFLCLCFSQAGHEPSAGHSAVGFVSDPEDYVSEWESRSTKSVLRLGNAIAQVTEEFDKPFFFVHLGIVIRGPFLGAGYFHGVSHGLSPIWLGLFLNRELNRMYMLAWLASRLEVGASAKWVAVVEAHNVSPVSRLRGNFPSYGSLCYLAVLCYLQSSFFSRVHLFSPFLLPNSICAYNTILGMGLSIPFGVTNTLSKPIDNHVPSMVHCGQMTEVQPVLATLRANGWTNTAIADEIAVTVNAVEKWQSGDRNISPSHLILLNQLTKKKPPKKRRYAPGSRG